MLSHGRIPMTNDEQQEVEQLLAEHGSEGVTLARRDPGESGPVVVQFPAGPTFTVDGTTVEEV